MKHLLNAAFFLAVLLGAWIPTRLAHADTGPKPAMDFQFTFESGQPSSTIVSGILFECDQSDCSDAAPLEELGPQGLYCEPASCRAIGYGFAGYHILEIEFSDGVTRRSNIFETNGFNSFYTVAVREDDLLVEPRINPLAPPVWLLVLIACACVLAGVGMVTGLVFFLRRRARA
jgi:hypothetical protein